MSTANESRPLLKTCVALVSIVAVLSAAASSSSDPQIQERVDRILSTINEHDRAGSADTFDAFSDDQLIPALVTALSRTPGYESQRTRAWAYTELIRRNAVQTELGFDQLIRGLSDTAVGDICAQALLSAPEEKEAEVVDPVRRYLLGAKRGNDVRPGIQSGVERVLQDIGKKGKSGLAYVDVLDTILRDQERAVEVRKAAACAIAQIKPLGEAMKNYQGLDAAGMEAAVAAAGARIAQMLSEASKERKPAGTVYQESRDDIETARALVLEALQSPRPETQAAALDAIGLVYGNDIMIVRSADDYELNPELRPLLKGMAQHHPERGVRERVVAGFLDPSVQRRMAQRILQIRQREAKRQDEGSP